MMIPKMTQKREEGYIPYISLDNRVRVTLKNYLKKQSLTAGNVS